MSEKGLEYKRSCEFVVKVQLWAVNGLKGRLYLLRLFEEMEKRGDISHFCIVREFQIGGKRNKRIPFAYEFGCQKENGS